MKIVFLDIDGILNSTRFLRELEATSPTDYFDPRLVRYFNEIIDVTDAKIVISPPWRRYYAPSMARILFSAGVRGDIVGQTNPGARVNGITAWLAGKDVESFVILEDHEPMADLEKHTVRTRLEIGLSWHDVRAAIRLLLRGPIESPTRVIASVAFTPTKIYVNASQPAFNDALSALPEGRHWDALEQKWVVDRSHWDAVRIALDAHFPGEWEIAGTLEDRR